ncbi:ESX secretion-associated protein EspG [Nocardia farcinica]|uniref:ESX secretion-associated protein EspG n=1 Tax=Nocardia farcinica TaxID=37329 RepID=UPI0024568459|nr:ESX secretion-associated protein EspG [Nocardia farcinica]
MTILGAGRGPSMLGGVTLALDEMQFLLEKLEFDELPVVLQAVGRYDNQADHDAAMQVAENSLVERDLLIDGVVHRELEDRLRTLYRPHWVLALRLVVEGQVSRMCLAPRPRNARWNPPPPANHRWPARAPGRSAAG